MTATFTGLLPLSTLPERAAEALVPRRGRPPLVERVELLRARRIEIVDDDGLTRMRMEVNDGGIAQLTILDRRGRKGVHVVSVLAKNAPSYARVMLEAD